MKNAIISAVVAALVASSSTFAATKHLFIERTTVVRSAVTAVAPNARGFATADCPSGATATGGGLTSSDIGGQSVTVTDSAPAPITGQVSLGWAVAVQNSSDDTAEIQAYAVCVR